MPSASKNIGCSNTSYKYTISVSWSESSPSVTNNTSKITASGSMSSSNVSFSANAVYNYYLRLYWHDNRTNTDTLFASSSAFHSCGMSYGSRSVSGSITVTHKDDGSLSGYVKMKFESPSTSGGWAPSTSWVQTANTALTTIARASDFTVNSYSNLGNAVNISISRKSTSFTHRVSYQFAGSSSTTVTTNAATSATFTPPLSLASRIPNATSGILTISVSTWNGSTQVGSAKNKTVTLGVPSSVVPTMGNPTVTRMDNGVPSSWGVYVKGYSKATVKINSAAGAYGSTIKSYSITGGGLNSGSSSATTGVLYNSGTVTFTCKITDSRGRTATKTTSISVVNYSVPSVTVSAKRCDASGTVNANGDYLRVVANYTIASVSSKNSVTAKSVTCNGVTNTTFSDNTAFILAANVSIGSSYILTATVTDALGRDASASIDIPTSSRILNVRKNKKGIAVGKFSEKDAFEVALPSHFYELATFEKGSWVKSVLNGTSSGYGENYYAKIARITVKQAWSNEVGRITLSQRGLNTTIDLYFAFDNSDNVDPSIRIFRYVGDPTFQAHIVKVATSIWEIYVRKTETRDFIAILDYRLDHSYSRFELEWTNEGVDVLPTGIVSFRAIDTLGCADNNGESYNNDPNIDRNGLIFTSHSHKPSPNHTYWFIKTMMNGGVKSLNYARSQIAIPSTNGANAPIYHRGIVSNSPGPWIKIHDENTGRDGFYQSEGTLNGYTVYGRYYRFGPVVTVRIVWTGTASANTKLTFSSLKVPEEYRPMAPCYFTVSNLSGNTVHSSSTIYLFNSDGTVNCWTNSNANLTRSGCFTWII